MNKEPKVVFSTDYFEVEQLDFESAEGADPHYRLTGPDSVIVCVFNEDSKILLVKQFRPSIGIDTLEFPAGAVDLGEKPGVAAVRETLEETGYRSSVVQLGEPFHLLMNRTNMRMFLFCGLTESEPEAEPEYGIRVVWLSRDELLKASLNGEFTQVGALGLLQVLGGVIQEDIWRLPDSKLQTALHKLLEKKEAIGE